MTGKPGATFRQFQGMSSLYPALLCGLLGLGITLLLIPLLRSEFFRRFAGGTARDFHHEHEAAVPRWGGLAFAVSLLVVGTGISLFAPENDSGDKTYIRIVMVGGALAMFGLGFWDDLKPIGARRKLVAQVLLATAVYFAGLRIDSFQNPLTGEIWYFGGWGLLVTILWLVGITNLINLIDGIDGLAGGICLMLMALLVYVGHSGNGFPLLASVMVGSLVGFLRYNFPPAKIYMGDGGAYMLGFLIGEMTIACSHKGTVAAALIAPLFVLTLPILDVSFAIIRRGLKGLPIFRPDRRHIHHRLLGMGFSHRRAVLVLYCFTVCFLALGFVAYTARGRTVAVAFGVAMLILLFTAGRFKFSREWFSVGRVLGNSLRMRQEVRYATALANWLTLEGGRVRSVETLWASFLFAAQRLGFGYVRLELADGERTWSLPGTHQAWHAAEFDFQRRGAGRLELRAVDCRTNSEGCLLIGREVAQATLCSCVAKPEIFEMMAELLAESWLKAGQQWRAERQLPLAFAARVTADRGQLSRTFQPVMELAPLPGESAKPSVNT